MKPIDVVGALEDLLNDYTQYEPIDGCELGIPRHNTRIAQRARQALATLRSGEWGVADIDWILYTVFSVIHEHCPEYKEVDVDIRNEIAQQIREKLLRRKEEK